MISSTDFLSMNKLFADKWEKTQILINSKLYDDAVKEVNELLKTEGIKLEFKSHLYFVLFLIAAETNKPEEEVIKYFDEANRLVCGLNQELWYSAALYYYSIENYDKSLDMILKCCALPDDFLINTQVGYNYNMLYYGRWAFLKELVTKHFPEKSIQELLEGLNN